MAKTNPYVTALADLDRQVWFLVKKLSPYERTEPDERIQVSEAILMLQTNRKAMVQELMAKHYGGNRNA